MSMTREEKYTKLMIMRDLDTEGYNKYADLLEKFDLNLTSAPRVVGFMEPAKGRIVVNRGLDEDQVSLVIRHEILHFYLEHEARLLKHVAKQEGLNYDELDDIKIKDLKNFIYGGKNFNIAGDYEISNLGYTMADKRNARAINLDGEILTGLVTEDGHPDWTELSIEEMFDLLEEEKKQFEDELKKGRVLGHFIDPTTFVDKTGVKYGI